MRRAFAGPFDRGPFKRLFGSGPQYPHQTPGNVLSLDASRADKTTIWKDLSKGYDVPCANAVTNGDFVNTTGWTPVASTVLVENNTYINTGNGSANYAATSTPTIPLVSGRKVFVVAKVAVTNSNCVSLRLHTRGSVTAGTIQLAQQINTPTINTEYTLSGVVTMPADASGNIVVRIEHHYADAPTQNGKVMEVQEVMCIDLSAAFGATREPLIGDFQRAMTEAGTTFWNGSKTLHFRNDATLYNQAGNELSGWRNECIECETGTDTVVPNLLGADGNMADTNGNGLADGWTILGTVTAKSVAGNIQTYTAGAATSGLQKTVTLLPNTPYYAFAIANGGRLQLKVGASTYVSGDASGGIVSCMGTTEAGFTSGVVWHMDVRSSGWTPFNVSKVFYIPKTGILANLTQANMDKLVQYALARYGYATSWTLRLAMRDMLRLDGTDDFGAFTNSPSLDLGVVAGREQWWGAVVRSLGGSNAYTICKNLDSAVTTQYGLLVDTSNDRFDLKLNGSSKANTPNNSMVPGRFHAISFYRNKDGLITPYINGVAKPTSTYADALITQPYVRLGRCEAASSHIKGDLVYQGMAEADTLNVNVLNRALWNVAKNYIKL